MRAPDEDKGAIRLSRAISALVQLTLDIESFGKDEKIEFSLYRSMLIEQLDAQVRGGGQALLQGICIARFQPFRLIPFEHIFCLGMDEGAFPAGEERRSLYQFIPGAPSAKNQRPQDLYSFLETIATYKRSLTILYQGRDPSSRTLRLPSAPVAALAAAAPHMVIRLEAGLHGFDQAQVPPDVAKLDPPWKAYEGLGVRNQRHRSIIAGTLAVRHGASQDQVDGQGQVMTLTLDTRDLDDLLTKPLRFYGRKRLGIKLMDLEDDMASDAMLYAPDRWEKSLAGSMVLGSYFAGKSEAEIRSDIEAGFEEMVRQGTIARGHFFETSKAQVLEQGAKKFQALQRAFGKARILGLNGYLDLPPLDKQADKGPLAFRFPPHQAAMFGSELSVSGFSEPWLVRTDVDVPEVFTLEEISTAKPDRSKGLKVLGRMLAMAAWLVGPEHGDKYAHWQLGTIFISKKDGRYQEVRGGFKRVDQWRVHLGLVEALAENAWVEPLPLLGDMFDDAELFAGLCAEGLGVLETPQEEALFQDYFAQNSTIETSPYAGYTAVPGNCPYFRLLFPPSCGPLGYEPWERRDLGSTYKDLAKLAMEVLPPKASADGSTGDSGDE